MAAQTVDTQIPVSAEMRDRLRAAKKGGERYDDVLNRLLEAYDADEKDVGRASDDGPQASSRTGE